MIGAYDVDGVVVDPGPASTVETLLSQVEPRALLLTHIHLDHAGRDRACWCAGSRI